MNAMQPRVAVIIAAPDRPGSPLQITTRLATQLMPALRSLCHVDEYRDTDLDDQTAAILLRRHDVIIGFSQFVLRQRQALKVPCPVLLPADGLAGKGYRSLCRLDGQLAEGDGFFCSSTAALLNLTTHLRTNAWQAHFLPSPLSVGEPALQRNDVQPSTGQTDLLYVGKLKPQNNIHLLLHCLAELRSRGRDCRLILQETAPTIDTLEGHWKSLTYGTHLQALALELGVRPYIDIRPTAKMDPSAVLDKRTIHVNLSTSLANTCDFTAADAAALGIPTVATAWGPHLDTVRHGVSGFHVPVCSFNRGPLVDERAAVDLLDALLSPERHQRLSRAARNWAQQYSADVFRSRLKFILDQLCSQRTASLRLVRSHEILSPAVGRHYALLQSAGQQTWPLAQDWPFPAPEFAQAFSYGYLLPHYNAWSLSSRPHRVTGVQLSGGDASVEWPPYTYRVSLDRPLQHLLHAIDGRQSVQQLASLLDVCGRELLLQLATLARLGLVIPHHPLGALP